MIPKHKNRLGEAGGYFQKVSTGMVGRIALTAQSAYFLGAIAGSEEGDHLEVGSLYGGSAILVAVLKTIWKVPGKVYCIDPLDGYYGDNRLDPVRGLAINRYNLETNINRFGMEDKIEIIQAKSVPVPASIRSHKFSTMLVDGVHNGLGPVEDFRKYQKRIKSYILFDNYEAKYPYVLSAVKEALDEPGWLTYDRAENMIAIRRAE